MHKSIFDLSQCKRTDYLGNMKLNKESMWLTMYIKIGKKAVK